MTQNADDSMQVWHLVDLKAPYESCCASSHLMSCLLLDLHSCTEDCLSPSRESLWHLCLLTMSDSAISATCRDLV